MYNHLTIKKENSVQHKKISILSGILLRIHSSVIKVCMTLIPHLVMCVLVGKQNTFWKKCAQLKLIWRITDSTLTNLPFTIRCCTENWHRKANVSLQYRSLPVVVEQTRKQSRKPQTTNHTDPSARYLQPVGQNPQKRAQRPRRI